MTLTPHIDTYVKTRIAIGRWNRGTAKSNRYHLNTLRDSFGKRPLDQLGPAAIERWLSTVNHLEPASKRTYASTIRGFCRWLVRERKIRRDPCTDLCIDQPRLLRRNMTRADVAELLNSVPDLRGRCVVWLMVGCGLRCIEVTRLGIGDYDRHTLTLRVVGKGGHERMVPVPIEAIAPIDAYLNSVRSTAGPLIRSLNHPTRGIKPKTLSGLVSQWMTEAGIKSHAYDGVSAHALRHTFATDVWQNSRNLAAVKELLGHANIATTSRYIGPTNMDDLRNAVQGREYHPPPLDLAA